MSSLFVYGTLMCTDIAKAVLGRTIQVEPARLKGYRRYSLAGESYPAVAASPNGVVEGHLWRGLSARDIQALDDFEGELYERHHITVQLGSSEEIAADVYVIREESKHLLREAPWDRDKFEKDDKDRFLREFL